MLYQLSYTHHVAVPEHWRQQKCSGPAPLVRTPFRTARRGSRQAGFGAEREAAMARAESLSGPGCGTKTAAR